MNSSTFAELLSAKFGLERSLCQLQSEQATCSLIKLELRMAEQVSHLAIIHLQKAQVELAIAQTATNSQHNEQR